MSNFIVIEKDSLNKVSVNAERIVLSESSIVHTKMNRDDVAEFIRDGNNLILKLTNGEVVVIENFFVVDAEGVTSDLVFEEDGCVLYWFDGVSGFNGISGLEALLPEGGSKLIGLLPWLAGAGIIGGVIAATDDNGKDQSTGGDNKAPTAPTVVINDGGDGSIDPSDLVNGKVTATVKPLEPVEEGDKVTITLPDGSTQEVIVDESNKDDINTNGIVVEFDKPADGTDVEVKAIVTDKAGNKSPEGSDKSTVGDTDRPQVIVEVTPEGDITLTYPEDTDPESIDLTGVTVKGPNGEDLVVDFGTPVVQTDGSITVIGKVPEGVDGTVTVTVPEGSYEDLTGNPGLEGKDDAGVDTDRPQVIVEVTPEGDITLTYPEDTDPESIDLTGVTVKGPNGEDLVVDFGTPEVQTDGSITVIGKVPEGVDGTVTVTVPEGSYEDLTGNPGLEGKDDAGVDTDRPQVIVEVTPEGDITLTYPEDTDPESIDLTGVTVKGPNGEDLVVDFGTPVVQTDGSITVIGKVPEGVDGTVTVTVPEGSYEDLTGNPGLEGKDDAGVDTDRPQVIVEVTPEGDITLTYPEDTDPESIDLTGVTVKGPNGEDLVVDFGTPVVQTDGSITVIGKVPEGVDGTVTVTVPEGSYEDLTGNPGLEGKDDAGVDTDRPQVIVEVTPEGDITLTYPEDTDPESIDLTGVTVKGPNGEDLVVDFGTPVVQTDGSITVIGKVPEGVDGTVTVTVPEGSYDDLTGNPGLEGKDDAGVDTDRPQVIVEVTPEGDITLTYPEDTDPESIDLTGVTVKGPNGEDLVVDFGTPVVQTDGSITVIGKVPEGVDGTVTVTVPEGSYEDLTGNPGLEGKDDAGVDTDRPQVIVEVTPEGDITLTYPEDTDPESIDLTGVTVKGPNGEDLVVDFGTPVVQTDGSITVIGKVPEGVDGTVTVTVPEGSYEDLTGNPGLEGKDDAGVDTDRPQVIVEVTPEGDITLTYPEDTDPESIDLTGVTVKGPNGEDLVVDFGTPVVQTDGSITVIGKVPEGVDGTVTVTVPEGSYEDLTGNPGLEGKDDAGVDTDRPQVIVEVTPEGDITLTYPEDTDPESIDLTGVTVKGPNGEDLVVDFGTPVVQTDGSITVIGKVPEGVDGTVTVTVPEGSYEDLTGNPGLEGKDDAGVDTDRPQVIVEVTPEGDITLTYPEDTDPESIDLTGVTVKGPNGEDLVVDFGTPVVQTDGSITVIGKVPEGVDGTVTVTVPEGSYEDLTGNPGLEGKDDAGVDTDRPQVIVEVTPEGDITLTYPEDTDPESIDLTGVTVKGPNGEDLVVDFGTPVVQTDGSITVIGKVPEGVDGTVTVTVPEGSYEDLTGNPGLEGKDDAGVDTDRPQVIVEVTPEGDITLTYPEDTDPESIDLTGVTVKGPNGEDLVVDFGTPVVQTDGSITVIGKVPEGVDGTVTVTVPEGSYEDLTGNPGLEGKDDAGVDTDRPQVIVEVTPEGDITLTYPEDTDPESIDLTGVTVKGPNGEDLVVDFGTPVVQTDGSITVIGKVPEGVDGTVTVTVPEGSYEDLTGNPGLEGKDDAGVDTDRPQVIVEVTPEGDITLTYPEDTDPESIDLTGVTVKGPNGEDLVVDFGTPVVQTDGSITVIGKVPEGVDGTVTVTVPEGSYEDLTGNPGLEGKDDAGVDTDRPQVIVEVTPEGDITLTYPEDTDPESIDLTGVTVKGPNGEDLVVDFGTPVVQTDGSITVIGKVPEGVDGTVTVTVPEGSYEDLTGNPGLEGKDDAGVDTDRPQVIVEVTPEGDITLTYPEDTDPESIDLTGVTVKGPNGEDLVVDFGTPVVQTDGSITVIGKVPEGVDGTVTVTVPEGSYEDLTGNPGLEGKDDAGVDTDRPQVIVEVTPEGDITLTYPEDTDPESIDLTGVTVKGPNGEDLVVDFGTPVVQTDGSITVIGKVPEGVDGTVTVTVPEGSYEDLTGNPGLEGKDDAGVDTDRPQVIVEVTPEGDITLTYPEDTDPESIDLTGVTVKGPNGEDLVVDFGTPVVQTDGSITVIGKVPEGVDGTVTVTVPEGSYEDLTGNPGLEGKDDAGVDTDRPQVIVEVTPEGDITLTYPEDTDPESIDLTGVTVKGPNGEDLVVDFGTPVVQTDGSITVIGKVPEGVDGTVTVTVPEGSYEDLTGNPGLEGKDDAGVDTDRPQVIVEVTPEGDITLTYPEDTDPESIDLTGVTVKGPNGEDLVVDFGTPVVQTDGSITVIGKVPEGVDGTVTVTVPEGSYEDLTGNPGLEGKDDAGVDTDRPQVIVEVTPEGDITLTYPEDTDPESIDLTGVTVKGPNGEDLVVDFGTPVVQTDGSITVIGKVPEGVDGTVTVTVPEGSYEDLTGNPGLEGKDDAGVDTDRPQVIVEVTPEGDITLTYPEDTDPESIDLTGVTVKGPNGEDLVVDFGTPVVQTDGSITVIGKVPEGVDGTVTVTVPEGSYEDLTGNPGLEGKDDAGVDTDRPQVIVEVTPEGDITLTYPEDTDPESIDLTGVTVKGPNGEDLVVDFGTPVVQTDGSITVIGKVPEGVDGTVTVTVPEGSYEDLTGNPGLEGKDDAGVDTDRPQVIVEVTPEGDITLTYPEDTDPESIDLTGVTVKGPNGEDLVVDFGTPVVQTDGSITVIGKVPEGVDGTVTVTVPEGSYEDLTGNPGLEGKDDAGVDTDRPQVIVEVTPEGDITLTYPEDTDPESIDLTGVTVKGPNGEDLVVDFGTPVVQTDGSITVIGKVPEGVDGTVTVTVPEGSYEDLTGNPGLEGKDDAGVDTDRPQVIVEVTPEGDITLTYPEDTDPESIDLTGVTVKGPNGEDLVVDFGTPVVQTDGSITVIGKVPEGVDGTVTVTVPEGSYEDLTGNPGLEGKDDAGVDTDRPQVIVEVTPEGDITLTYPEDTDPESIDLTGVTVKGPNGEDLVVDFGTPVVQTDGSITVIGKVPEGVDGTVTVTVPEGSYEDLTGNPGLEGKDDAGVDTDRPQVIVEVTPEGDITLTYPEDTDPESIDLTGVTVKGPNGEDLVVDFGTPVVQTDGSITVIGKVPEGVDGTVTVTVPEGSYEDLTGNPGLEGKDDAGVDTDRPQVIVEVTPEGDITLTYPEDTDPESIDLTGVTVKGPNGEDLVVDFGTPVVQTDGSITVIGKVPEGVDGTVTVTVPEGSYEDLTGNPGLEGKDDAGVDTDRPQVIVEVTPEGDITLTYPEDTDPESIDLTGVTVKGPNGEDLVVDFGTPVVQTDGSITVIGKVPEGVDGTVTVTVPEGSYEDLTGNPGLEGKDDAGVDTDRPQVIVEVTPEGDITLTYPEDTDPESIDLTGVTVKGPNGEDLVVDFGTPVVQTDGSITVIGKVPEGVDGTVTVTVPEGSYEDLTGNPGLEGKDDAGVDTDRPQVIVEVTPEGDITLTYPEDTDPESIDLTGVTVKGPNGEDLVVDFGTPVVQTDGSITVIGKVPEGVDGTVTVTVPEGSYEDLTGNPGLVGTDTEEVDTVPETPAESGATATVVGLTDGASGTFDNTLPGLSEVEVDENGDYVTIPGATHTKVTDYYKEYVAAMNQVRAANPGKADSELSNEFGNAINNLGLSNYSGENTVNNIYYLDLDALLSLGLADDKIPTRANGSRGEASDWMVFKEPFDPDVFKVTSKILNPATDNLNRIDGYFITVTKGGKTFDYVLNNIQGIMFGDGTTLTYDASGSVALYSNYDLSLSSELLGTSKTDGSTLHGVKFKADQLLASTTINIQNVGDITYTPEVYYNGVLITADEDGWFTITDTDSSPKKDFNVSIKVPNHLYGDGKDYATADAFKNALNESLHTDGNVLPVADLVGMAGRSLRTAEANDENDFATDEDSIFKVLNQEYSLSADGETHPVDGFTVGSEDQIDVSSLLSADATESNLAEFISVDYDAENKQAVISIDRDGAAEQYQSEQLVVLLNQQDAFKLEDLVQHNQIIIG